jgi:hypothetical protein
MRTTSLNGWKPFPISEPQDTESTQVVLDRGGAAIFKEFFKLCHCTIENLPLPSQVPYQDCFASGITVCLHPHVCGGDWITKAKCSLGILESY